MNIPNLSQIFMNFTISAKTASRELEELYKKGVIEKKGKGPAVYYLKKHYEANLWSGKQHRGYIC